MSSSNTAVTETLKTAKQVKKHNRKKQKRKEKAAANSAAATNKAEEATKNTTAAPFSISNKAAAATIDTAGKISTASNSASATHPNATKDSKSISESSAQATIMNAARTTTQQPSTAIALSECDDQIIFGIADLRYNKGKVKTLEWGDAFLSGIKDLGQVMTDCEKFLTKFGLPLLTREEILNKLSISEKPKSKPNTLRDYHCILKRPHKTPFETFQNTTVFMLNNSPFWELLSQHKNILFELFAKAGCTEAVPLTRTYHQSIFGMHERANLANNILKDFSGIETLVFKAPHSSDGLGVFVVKASDLENTLPILLDGNTKEEYEVILNRYRQIFANKKSETEIDQDITQAMSWREAAMRLPEFLVQAYCPSDNLDISGKQYDATMRVTYLMILKAGNISFQPLSSYWKVPVSPIDGPGLRDKTISNVHEGIGRYPTDKIVEMEVFKQLEPVMIAVFKEMFTANPRTYIESLIHSEDKRKKLRGIVLALQYAKGLNALYLYSEVFEILKMIRNDIKNLNIIKCSTLYSKILAEAQLHSEYFSEAEKTLTEAIKLADTAKDVTDETCAELYLFRAFIFSVKKDSPKAKADRDRANTYHDKSALTRMSDKIAYIAFGNKVRSHISKDSAAKADKTGAHTELLRLGQYTNDMAPRISQQAIYDPKAITSLMKKFGFDSQKLQNFHYTPVFNYENKSPYGFIRKLTVDGNVLSIYFRDFSSRYIIQSNMMVDAEYGGLPLDEKTMSEYHQNVLEALEHHQHLWYKEAINVRLLKRFMSILNSHERRLMNDTTVDGTGLLTEANKKMLLSRSLTATMDLEKIPKSLFCFESPEHATNDQLANICWLPVKERNACLLNFTRYMGKQADDVMEAEDGHTLVGSANVFKPYDNTAAADDGHLAIPKAKTKAKTSTTATGNQTPPAGLLTAYTKHAQTAVNSKPLNSVQASIHAIHKQIVMAAMKGDVNRLQALVPDFIREHDINMYYHDASKKGENDVKDWGTVMHMAAIAGKTEVLLYLEFELEGKSGDISKQTNLPNGKTPLQYLEEMHPHAFPEYQKKRLECIKKKKSKHPIIAHS